MKLIYTPILLLLSVACFAQKPLSVTYYKDGFRFVKSKDSADYIRVILPADTTSPYYQLRDYYARNKRIRFKGAIADANHVNAYEGKCEVFYPDGHLKLRAFYKHGNILGKAFEYYPNGKLQSVKQYAPTRPGELLRDPLIITCIDSTGKPIVNNGNGYYKGYITFADFEADRLYEEGPVVDGLRNGTWHGSTNPIILTYTTPTATPKLHFTEQYENGMLISGEAIDSAGTKHHYTHRIQSFGYNGGMQKFSEYLQQAIKYPMDAKRNNIQGVVIVTFDVNVDGSISNAKVARGVNRDLDNEALKVIKQSPNEWVSSEEFGIPLTTHGSVPINFTLK